VIPEIVPPGDREITHAANVLRDGGLVAFPTETVYGLGADASSPAAVRRLFAVKRRPRDHPVIIHVASSAAARDWVAEMSPAAAALAAACWPGPLTLVLRRSARVPDDVTGGLDTVGVRVPAEPTALALLESFGGAVAAPSANRFGRVSPTTATAVHADLGDDVDVVLDGGPCRVGVESTIVDCSGPVPAILRVGGVPRERVEAILGVRVAIRDDGAVRAPGTLPSHYAPDARVVVVADEYELAARVRDETARGARVGVIAGGVAAPDAVAGVTRLGSPREADEYARLLYQWLRDADARGLDVVVAVAPDAVGIGAAVSDRLRRAAANRGGEDRPR
jgi:L-threonylcarbamoyladenylate synthase